ncbi:MAG: hypothetical protein BroJett026_08370 [Betaproteobacteria bacterium]|nr:MAG: hypothetical protein BroJett026_08370 [Betaproteobacteria bacterium]
MPRDPAPPPARWADDATTLFASPAWFEWWMEAFGGGEHGSWRPPHGAYAVPYVVRTRRAGGVPLRVAIGAANAYTPQYDTCGEGVPAVPELRRMLRDLRCAALELPFLAPQSRALRAASAGAARGANVVATESAPQIDCSGDWDAYLASRSKSRRKEWREKERALAATGARLEVLATWSEIATRFEELLDVEASGWKGRNGSAIRQRPHARRFFGLACPALADAGKLRVLAIVRDGRTIAFKLCTLHGGRMSSLKTGYLDEFASQSPGQVLQLWTARWCFEQPDVKLFDFLSPSTPHKLAWATAVEPLHSLFVYGASLPGALAWLRWSVGPRVRARVATRSRPGEAAGSAAGAARAASFSSPSRYTSAP